MMGLTFATGLSDAVGYLGLDKVFTGNMTGNVVIIGMGLAGGNGLPVVGPLIALGGFSVGAFLAGSVLRKHGPNWTWRISTLLAVCTTILAAAAIVGLVLNGVLPHDAKILLATVMAFEMGVQACVARRLAVRDMTTVVITSTLVSLAGESLAGTDKGKLLNRRLAAIAAIFGGALVGTLLLSVHVSLALSVVAILTAGVTVAGHLAWNTPAAEPAASGR